MQGVNTGESGAPNGEQGMRTQEIHIVSSNAHRQAYASMQNQRLQKQFEPMTFSNTPFPAEKEGHRRGKAESTPRWRFAFVASLIAIDLAVMLLSLTVSLVINGAAFDAIGDVMPFWLFLILFSLIWLLCLAFAGTYHRHVMADGYELHAKIINASLLTIISYCSLAFIFKLALPRTALIIAQSSPSSWISSHVGRCVKRCIVTAAKALASTERWSSDLPMASTKPCRPCATA